MLCCIYQIKTFYILPEKITTHCALVGGGLLQIGSEASMRLRRLYTWLEIDDNTLGFEILAAWQKADSSMIASVGDVITDMTRKPS